MDIAFQAIGLKRLEESHGPAHRLRGVLPSW